MAGRIQQGERIERLFAAAARRPASERHAFLEQACGGDRVLRTEVESLLQAEERAGDLLSRLNVEQPTEASGGEAGAIAPGRIVGAYQLQTKIGEGGMSTVYLATRADEQFRKRVAIKLLPLAMASADHLRRFRTERYILASLDHPNIAQLHDAGTTEEGLPYFVMEYIEGERIDAYCDRHRLSIRERLELFRKVCSAVHYAHQNLVVHRDLKASNVMVTEDGVPKLLDFGIAKLLNPELTSPSPQPTVTWHRVMTPEYASPEQIQGKAISTASDVYSLGVLLYQLLTGRLPYRLGDKTPQEIERIVTADEPEPPSTTASEIHQARDRAKPFLETVSRARDARPVELHRQLAGDLDNIVLMALRKEPQRRYSSAEQLAEDLGRHLDGLPVRARKGTFTYRWGKLLRRNRLAVAAVAAFLMMAMGFVFTVALQASRIARERDQARTAAAESEQVLAFMKRVFKEADPTESRGETITLREALDRGSDRLPEELANQPEVQASLFQALGEIYFNLGAYDKARTLLASALATRRSLLGKSHPGVTEILGFLGSTHHKLGEYDTAEDLHRQALAISKRNLGDQHPEILERINNLVAVLGDKGDYQEAVPLARRALALARGLPGDHDPLIMNSLQNLAGLLYAQGDYQETVDLLKQALELQRQRLGAEHPDTAFATSSLGVVLYRQGAYDEARRMHEDALAIQRKVLGPEHPDLARTLNNLAVLLGAQGDYATAERILREVLELRTRVLGRDHPEVVYTLRGLATLLIDSGSPAAAEPLLRESLEIWRRKLSPGNWQTAWVESLLGKCLTVLGRYAEAEPLLVESYPRLEAQLGAEDPQTREALERLVALYQAWGKPAQAAEYKAVLTNPDRTSGSQPRPY